MEEGTPLANFPKLVEFEDTFRNPDEHVPLRTRVCDATWKMASSCSIRKYILGMFPFIHTLQTYSIKSDLLNDFIAGITSGVMMIPQGMAFAALSTLPPIVGLYISFFASITYFFLGTGRQLSWGCIAVLSLMIASILDKYENKVIREAPHVCINGTMQLASSLVSDASDSSDFSDFGNWTAGFPNSTQKFLDEAAAMNSRKLEVASGVTIIAGLILIVSSRLGLSRIASLMSDSLITGFTVGISFHVATSQIKTIFGISVPRFSGVASIIKTWIEILKKLPDTNLATLITSALCMLVIYLVKKCVNERFKKKMRVPIPIELAVVIVVTLISYFAHFHDNFDMKVVKEVPVGVPAPKIPDIGLASDYIGDGVVIIVIAYAQTLAMAKTMGLKHNYIVDSNQEMLACGMCSVVCGLFSGYITAGSVSRTVVQDGAGGKTQIASLFAAGLVLLVIMVIGPYFYHLPMCALSAIIVINLRTMFLKLLVIPTEWRRSRYDCAVWVFTCIATIVLNPDIGLLAGIVFSLSLIVVRALITPVVEAGQIQTSPLTVVLRSLQHYSSAKILRNVKIIQIKTPLYFINADIFTASVFSKTGVDPIKLKKRRGKTLEVVAEQGKEIELIGDSVASGRMLPKENERQELSVVVLDAAEVSFIDLMGVQALELLITEFSAVDIELLITSAPESIHSMLRSTGFWKKHGHRIFLSVEAALGSIVTTASATAALCNGDKQPEYDNKI